ELQRTLLPLGKVIALSRQKEGGLVGDLGDLQGLRQTLASVQPNIIVNAAAYTSVDSAESEEALARQVNGNAVRLLSEYAAATGSWLIHYSTDYVFSGEGNKPWDEDDDIGPLNIYGVTKLEGECAIRQSGCKHLIFRTSWVYGARGNNFATTMLKLAAEREHMRVVDDQIGAPTGAKLIADVTAQALSLVVLDSIKSGTYHLAAHGEISWYGYAQYIITSAKAAGANLKVHTLEGISTANYPTPAQRPLNSRLSTRKIQAALNIKLPDWQDGVDRMLIEMQGL
ncbi:MAG: dTDP-4-dehydrorhamnose reductase, partial [Sphingobacteriales bacterium]